MSQKKADVIKSIAIIGAGPSGLATAKYLIEEHVFSKIVIYEQRRTVGGVWNYTPLPPNRHDWTRDDRSRHQSTKAIDVVTADLPDLNTPMYEHLETNLPHMLMQYSDTPFPDGTQLFPSRETVLQYLQSYAEALMPLIRFEHEVIQVKPRGGGTNHGWDITVKCPREGRQVESFDAVVAANGHCDWPLLPDIEGLDAWSKECPESLHHSVSYKNAKAFADKRVLLVGGGPSGADIGGQIATVCKHPLLVAQTQKSPYYTDEPFIRDYPTLVALIPEERAARFADGNIERGIDDIVLCTGYTYRFPFLTELHPDIGDKGIRALPLYQYISHTQYPTLAFIETPEMIVPFPLAESQAAVIARLWSGRLTLPEKDKMKEWRDDLISERGTGRGFHALEPPLDLRYMKEMYDWSSKAESKDLGTSGKMPKRWDAEACWLRMMAPEIKKAFNAKGEQRSNILSYQELGFQYDEQRNS